MVDDERPSLAHADPGSATWQPDEISSRQTKISEFLEGQFAFPFVREAAMRTLELLALEPGGSVLDMGCGNGAFLPLLARVVGPRGRVVGLDHAPAFVAEARSRVAAEGLEDTVSVVEGDAYGLPFEDGSFDAARCERVLMHLDDPTAALSEMRRVVQPGGTVVATEPDWVSLVLDHPDPEVFDMLYARFVQRFRQPRMGRSLYRRMHEAGLVKREIATITTVHTDPLLLQQSGLDLQPQADELVAEGQIDRSRADSAASYIDAANDAGVFFSGGIYFIVAGRVPAV